MPRPRSCVESMRLLMEHSTETNRSVKAHGKLRVHSLVDHAHLLLQDPNELIHIILQYHLSSDELYRLYEWRNLLFRHIRGVILLLYVCVCVPLSLHLLSSIDCIILFVRTLSDGSFQFMVLSSTANDCMDLNGEFDNTSRWLSEQWTQPAWNFWAATQVAGSSLNSALECNQFMLKYIINLVMEGVRYVLMIRMAMNLHDWCQPLPFILDTSNFPIQFSYSCGVLHNT